MKAKCSACAMLRPALVALVYDEPHPEAGKAVEHLASCAVCRAEEAELRETRRWVEAATVEPQEPAVMARLDAPRWRVRHLEVAAAALLVVLLLGLPDLLRPAGRPQAVDSGGGTAYAPGPSASPRVFLGDDLDFRIRSLERELSSLRRDPSW